MSLSEYSVIKRDFSGNRYVPSNFMSDIEYSVITSDVTKSSDCILLEGLNQFHDAPTSPLVQIWIKTHRYFKMNR